ncbi:hypothetical protein [Candidatus Nitrospira nitrificans]|uniref:DUF5666 domain-containing protein n=1 Tax=Candidatus Nitrospira nitrificans TaxID=1742973 RepID=A0A0S4LRK6_9BACT|nr:hypothetical protein [Candidatus Nitrospira nitrificans]CUS39582.1 exported hypothetical protein [Candidatus Nitrospira nitrificans]
MTKPHHPQNNGSNRQTRPVTGRLNVVLVVAGTVSALSLIPALTTQGASGTGGGETSQQAGQQSLGLRGGESSNVIMGGPEIIVGTIEHIQGNEFAIRGNQGQHVRLNVTKDTNKVCSYSDGARVTTGHGQVREQSEIPPTPAMEEAAVSGRSMGEQRQSHQRQASEGGQASTPRQDPSQMKAVVGTTDSEAKKDAAKGSGFSVGPCEFKVGDQVRVEGSDMGTVTTIKQLSSRSLSTK